MKQRKMLLENLLESMMPFGVQWSVQETEEAFQVRWRAGCASYSVMLRHDVGEGLVAPTLERAVQEAMVNRYQQVILHEYRIHYAR